MYISKPYFLLLAIVSTLIFTFAQPVMVRASDPELPEEADELLIAFKNDDTGKLQQLTDRHALAEGIVLLRAIKHDDTEKLQQLIDRQVDLDQSYAFHVVHDRYNYRTYMVGHALTMAAAYGSLECIRLLAKYGTGASRVPGSPGDTPLNAATWFGHLEAVRILVQLGASPLAYGPVRGNKFQTFLLPIHVAASNGHTDIARYLLSLYPETINFRTLDSSQGLVGFSPLMLALRHLPNDETGMYSLLLSPGINADPNLRVGRQTAIHFACEWLYRIDESSFDPVIVRLILEHPAYDPESINSPGARGLTPWQLADGHKEVLDLLKGATEPKGDD